MEIKKIDVLAYVVVLAFFAIVIVLVKDFNARRTLDYKEYTASVTNLVRLKNSKIRILFNQLMAKEKENEDLKNALVDTRNALDVLSKKLAQQALVTTPASAPAPVAAPAPMTAPAPATATK